METQSLPPPPPPSDSKYAEELQLQEALIASQMYKSPSISTPDPDETVFLGTLIVLDDSESGGGEAPDSKYAEELQLQETLVAAAQIPNPNPLAVQAASVSTPEPHETVMVGALVAVQDSGEASQMFCEICAEKKDSDRMFKAMSCAHSVCSGCIASHVAVKVCGGGGSGSVTCPGLACPAVLDPVSCRGAVPPEVLSRWEAALCEALIAEPQKFYCPFRDCSALLVDDGEGGVIRESECPICRRLFCAQCYVPWHSGVGCEEYARLGEHEREREDLMVREMARNASWNRCPHCKFYVEKTEGCLHIICRCGFQFCYGCGSQWTSAHGGCERMLRN